MPKSYYLMMFLLPASVIAATVSFFRKEYMWSVAFAFSAGLLAGAIIIVEVFRDNLNDDE
jgi:hypothetical protein